MKPAEMEIQFTVGCDGNNQEYDGRDEFCLVDNITSTSYAYGSSFTESSEVLLCCCKGDKCNYREQDMVGKCNNLTNDIIRLMRLQTCSTSLGRGCIKST